MPDDLAQRAARHRPYQPKGEWELETPKPRCIWDEQPWPCDASQLAAALAVEAVARSWAEQQLAAAQAARVRAEASLITVRTNLRGVSGMEALVEIITNRLADGAALAGEEGQDGR